MRYYTQLITFWSLEDIEEILALTGAHDCSGRQAGTSRMTHGQLCRSGLHEVKLKKTISQRPKTAYP